MAQPLVDDTHTDGGGRCHVIGRIYVYVISSREYFFFFSILVVVNMT
jgi:hypothetical protein